MHLWGSPARDSPGGAAISAAVGPACCHSRHSKLRRRSSAADIDLPSGSSSATPLRLWGPPHRHLFCRRLPFSCFFQWFSWWRAVCRDSLMVILAWILNSFASLWWAFSRFGSLSWRTGPWRLTWTRASRATAASPRSSCGGLATHGPWFERNGKNWKEDWNACEFK